MGDGLLAVFPIDEYVGDVRQVCGHVLDAARESRASVEAMHYPIGETLDSFRFGLALHDGRMLYGNIGGGNRLDFTCIGPPSISRHGWKRSPAAQPHRRGFRRFAGICAEAGTISANFRSRDFPAPQRVYGLLDGGRTSPVAADAAKRNPGRSSCLAR